MKSVSFPASAGAAWYLLYTLIRYQHRDVSSLHFVTFLVFLSTLLCTFLLIYVYHVLTDDYYSAHSPPPSPL